MSEVIKANRTDADGNPQPFSVADWDNLFRFAADHGFVEFVADETGIAEIWLTERGKFSAANPAAVAPCRNRDCTKLTSVFWDGTTPFPFCSTDCKKEFELWGDLN